MTKRLLTDSAVSVKIANDHLWREPVANLHVTSFRIVSGILEELLELLKQPGGFLDILRAANGFRQYSLADVGRGEVTTISVWDSAQDAEAVSGVVGAWMQENLSGKVEMTYMAIGDVALLEDMG